MANIKSAIKRIKITKRNTLENKMYTSNVKTFTKKYLASLEEYKENPNPANLAIVTTNLFNIENSILINYSSNKKRIINS